MTDRETKWDGARELARDQLEATWPSFVCSRGTQSPIGLVALYRILGAALIVLVIAAALAGCGQSPKEAAQAARDCRAHGGFPMLFVGADWRLSHPDGEHGKYVRCLATYDIGSDAR